MTDEPGEKIDEAISALAEVLERLKSAPTEVRETTEYWRAWASLFVSFDQVDGLLGRIDRERRSQLNRSNAKRKRRKRGPSAKTQLIERAFGCMMYHHPDITASLLCDILDADGRLTFEDDDIEFRLDAGYVVVRDLSEDANPESAAVKATSLRAYLSEHRKT